MDKRKTQDNVKENVVSRPSNRYNIILFYNQENVFPSKFLSLFDATAKTDVQISLLLRSSLSFIHRNFTARSTIQLKTLKSVSESVLYSSKINKQIFCIVPTESAAWLNHESILPHHTPSTNTVRLQVKMFPATTDN